MSFLSFLDVIARPCLQGLQAPLIFHFSPSKNLLKINSSFHQSKKKSMIMWSFFTSAEKKTAFFTCYPCLIQNVITRSSGEMADFSLVAYARLPQSFSPLKPRPFLKLNQQPVDRTKSLPFIFFDNPLTSDVRHNIEENIYRYFHYTHLQYHSTTGKENF